MAILDDLLAVNPAANNVAVACLATTRTNEQCGVSAINAIIRDNNNRQETEKEKEKRKQKEREQGTATWKKIQRNVQRGRKVVVADNHLEYLAMLFLCTRHQRWIHTQNLVQRIKDDIDTHHQKLTAAKSAMTRRQQMNLNFDFSDGLAWARPSRRRARRLEAERNARREENESASSQPNASDNSGQNSGAAEQLPPAEVEVEVDTSLNPPPPRPPLPISRWTTLYNQIPQPTSPVTVRSMRSTVFRQPPQPFGRRRRSVARKPIQTGDECSICLEELDGDGELVWCRTQCGNNFHRPCISNWLERHPEQPSATCPACRELWMRERDWPELR